MKKKWALNGGPQYILLWKKTPPPPGRGLWYFLDFVKSVIRPWYMYYSNAFFIIIDLFCWITIYIWKLRSGKLYHFGRVSNSSNRCKLPDVRFSRLIYKYLYLMISLKRNFLEFIFVWSLLLIIFCFCDIIEFISVNCVMY